MGKIVKYCGACDEDWAEKFGFCPTCGATLETFEMSRVAPAAEVTPVEAVAVPAEVDAAPVEFAAAEETPVVEDVAAPVEEESDPKFVAAPEPVEEPFVAPPPATAAFVVPAMDADAVRSSSVAKVSNHDDGLFHVTEIKPKGTSTLLLLILGAFLVINLVLVAGVVKNLFDHDLDMAAINDSMGRAILMDDVMTVEEEEKQKPDNKKAGGGGGGGGNEDPEPAQAGVRPPMMKNPQMAPSSSMDRLTNPTIPVQMAIKGPIDEKTKDPNAQYGVLNGGTIRSDGPGSNGGMGTGRNGGVGPGNGPGYGPGSNGGFGGGNTGGIGPGDGPGNGGLDVPPERKSGGVTAGLKITGKPKPGYTDAARQAQVQGTVVLRVIFLASGGIGGVSVVKGLPNGLSEQAMAAARRISFTPAMSNGNPTTVTKQVEYSFSIY